MVDTRHLQVTPDHVTARLDLFLVESLPDLSRSQIKRLIDDGGVTLNGNPVKAGMRLRGGEAVVVVIPELAPAEAEPEAIPLTVLYEDSSLIVINKPAHMVVHPAPGHQSGTLVNALLHHCQDLSGVGGTLRPGIVHRLDKETSGVMVATKEDRAHQHLASQFKLHSIQRRYLALVYGQVAQPTGRVDLSIGRHPVERKKMSTRSRQGRRAVTHWRVLRSYDQDRLSLVELTLETGRTHQIRVHLANMNHPVVGDPVYGSNRKPRMLNDPELRRLIERTGRQFLHAWLLGFNHPDDERPLEFYAELPAELQDVIDYLENKYDRNPAALDLTSGNELATS
jgi:23S rRNA pseudouridine1911/1915/1917 synthase